MKKAYLKELAHELLGTVTDDAAVLEQLATDASIFQVLPAAAVYPANTADVRRLVEFALQRTAAGKPLSLTARGLGADRTGGAIGEGISVVFPAHMNKLLRLEPTAVTVQSGMSLQTLQQTLLTHGRWLPGAPADLQQATVGGALSLGAAGPKAVKYGGLRRAVKSLKVVLADGSVISVGRLSPRELSRKRGLATLEGEIYRGIANLLADHGDLITKRSPQTPCSANGYALNAVAAPGHAFDLGQLFIGAQGTLGFITEVTLATAPFHPRTTLVVGGADTLNHAGTALAALRELGPSQLEFVDRAWIEHLREHRPSYLADLLPDHSPRIFFLVEFDDVSQLAQKYKSVRAARILARAGAKPRTTTGPLEQFTWWNIRRSILETSWPSGSVKPALPILDAAVVPLTKWADALDKTAKLLVKYDLQTPIWGNAGLGQLALRPALDLGRKKDVDKLFNLSREFTDLIVSLGGSPSGHGGDGLLHGPLLEAVYGPELAAVHAQVKTICDPHGLFNPHTKTGATEAYAHAHLRPDYTAMHSPEYLPSS